MNRLHSLRRVSVAMCRALALSLLASVALLAVLPQSPAAPPAAAPAAAPAASTVDPAAIDKLLLAEAKKDSQIMANLTYLSDVIGSRLTGSPALKKANDWTAEKMKAYGLSNVHLEGWTIPVGWERGTASMRIIEPDNGRSLTVAAMGWSPPTKGKISGEVVIIKATNSAELAKYKGKLKNAVVLQGAPARIGSVFEKGNMFERRRPADAKGPQGKAERNGQSKNGQAKGKARPGAKGDGRPQPVEDRMARFAAQAAFRRELTEFLRNEGAAVMLRDAGKPHGLLNMTGSWRGNDRASGGDPLPALFVAHEHYAQLYRLASRPEPAKTRVEVEITSKLIPGPIAVYNTVGELRGSEKPDEVVVLGAHLDSWDLGQGTTDNGTGSAVVLEAARILVKSGIRPKRTIRFILFTGEEEGLHGSREYVTKHKDELPKISMALVHDTGTGKVTGFYMQGRKAVQPILERELVSLKQLGVTELDATRSMGGSDHASFDRAGVPGFAVRQDPAEYRFTHHSQSDTLDKANEADLIQGAQVMVVTAVRVANLPDLLPRDKPPQPERGARRPAAKKN